MPISNDTIELVKDSTDFVALVSERTEVRRNGRQWMARCCFHDDRTPSLSINADKGLYRCFGCDAKGNVFQFVQHTQGLGFAESVEWLAARAGINISSHSPSPPLRRRPRPARRASQPEPFPRRRLHEGLCDDQMPLQLLADLVHLPVERLQAWGLTVCRRQHYGGVGGPTALVARVALTLPDATLTGGIDRVLDPLGSNIEVGDKKMLPGSRGGFIFGDRLALFKQPPLHLVLCEGLTDTLVMSGLVKSAGLASQVAVIGAAAKGILVETAQQCASACAEEAALWLIADPDAETETTHAATVCPSTARDLRPLLPKGCKDPRAAAATWHRYYARRGIDWPTEEGARLKRMLNQANAAPAADKSDRA